MIKYISISEHEKMKYVSIMKKGLEFSVDVTDENPEMEDRKNQFGVTMDDNTQCILCLEDENALAELLHAFACVVAKENIKMSKNVAKGIIKSLKDGIRKLANKGKEEDKTEEE